jgi:hypothetical protein
MVPKGRFELPRPYGHYALNVARLPVPPLRPAALSSAYKYIKGETTWQSRRIWTEGGKRRLRLFNIPRPGAPKVTLLSRPGCGLCEEAEREVKRVFGAHRVDVVDITGDAELESEFVFRIPVLIHEGRIVGEGRIERTDAARARDEIRSALRHRRE